MHPIVAKNHITSIHPLWAVEGGRIAINGMNLITEGFKLPEVYLGSEQAQVVHASSQSVSLIVPTGLKRGHTPVRFGDALGETVFDEAIFWAGDMNFDNILNILDVIRILNFILS